MFSTENPPATFTWSSKNPISIHIQQENLPHFLGGSILDLEWDDAALRTSGRAPTQGPRPLFRIPEEFQGQIRAKGAHPRLTSGALKKRRGRSVSIVFSPQKMGKPEKPPERKKSGDVKFRKNDAGLKLVSWHFTRVQEGSSLILDNNSISPRLDKRK